MSAVRVKDKAQITLPVRVRKALGIKEGDYLNVSLEGGRVMLTPQVMLDRPPEGLLSAEGLRMVEEAREDVR
jgi:AbrB family looped-hinge helix DNA binding protein